MKLQRPPVLATWLLRHFGPQLNAEALAGDLLEEFQEGRPSSWYWRQVLATISWRRHLLGFVVVAGYAWFFRCPDRPIMTVVFTAILLSSFYVPEMLSATQRILAGAPILIAGVLFFHYLPEFRDNYSFIIPVAAFNFVFHRKRTVPPSFKITYRELLFGDPQAERCRLISQLERTMSEETDPERRDAYAKSLMALRAKSRDSLQLRKRP